MRTRSSTASGVLGIAPNDKRSSGSNRSPLAEPLTNAISRSRSIRSGRPNRASSWPPLRSSTFKPYPAASRRSRISTNRLANVSGIDP